ncbi:sensor histidine kinase [Verrucomicrobiota bacterium sgz303538]
MTANIVPPLERLADYLSDHRDRIGKEWMTAIHEDPRIQTSETLTVRQLQDHFPILFDHLRDALRVASVDAVQRETKTDGRAHGLERWEQGYRLDELIRELGRVREVIVDRIFAFANEDSGFSQEALRHALATVNGFFDDLACRSAQSLVEQEEDRLKQRAESAEQGTEKLRVGNEQLRQVDESRLRLLRTVSHELRNLLNAVKLSGEALAEDDNEVTRRRLAVMLYRNVDHMDDLLEDLLDFSALLSGHRETKFSRFEPAVLLEEVLYGYEPLAEAKALHLEGDSDPSLGALISDELKVKQIASNLVSNALKYTAHGSVRLCFRGVDTQRWMIEVEDTGPGIPSKDIDRIFHEFHRVKETAHQDGTGLGLAITKRLVDLLGGQIRVESVVGKGSRFEVLLPRRSVLRG